MRFSSNPETRVHNDGQLSIHQTGAGCTLFRHPFRRYAAPPLQRYAITQYSVIPPLIGQPKCIPRPRRARGTRKSSQLLKTILGK